MSSKRVANQEPKPLVERKPKTQVTQSDKVIPQPPPTPKVEVPKLKPKPKGR